MIDNFNSNVNPEKEEYKVITPFKLFIKGYFPFIEDTMEALDNYGLLCKVVEYLNNVIENENTTVDNINTLYSAFNSFINEVENYLNIEVIPVINNKIDYIDNYFENLDVQTEINNKIDSMVLSGEFGQIVNQYLIPFENDLLARQTAYETQINIKTNQIETKVNQAIGIQPIPVSSTSGMTDTTKIYVNTTDGYWYYYNGTQWTQGGIYQSSDVADEVFLTSTQLFDVSNFDFSGYYTNGNIINDKSFGNIILPFTKSTRYYTNFGFSNLRLTYFDSDMTYIGQNDLPSSVDSEGHNYFEKTNVSDDCAFISIPIRKSVIFNIIISSTPVYPINKIVPYNTAVNYNRIGKNDNEFSKILKLNMMPVTYTEVKYLDILEPEIASNKPTTELVLKTNGTPSGNYPYIKINSNQIICCFSNGKLLIGVNDNEIIYIDFITRNIIKHVQSSGSISNTSLYDFSSDYTYNELNCMMLYCILSEQKIIIKNYLTNEIILEKYISELGLNVNNLVLGIVGDCYNITSNNADLCSIYNKTIFNHYKYFNNNSSEVNHWSNKNWYAYGTSITYLGNYTTPLASLLNSSLTNKGISGGGITPNIGGYSQGQVKTAIMNTTDGKLNADLITLEVGANDAGAPLGTIYDTGNDTYAGCLNQCIRYLQANTNAQIVVFSSQYRLGSGNKQPQEHLLNTDYTFVDMWNITKEICRLNSCYYIDMAEECNMGYSRLLQNKTELETDGTHPTQLGGYNMAQCLYSRLKNIPLWFSQIPN